MTQKSKVYIVQNVMRKYPDGTLRSLDYTQAERFGEVIILFDGNKQVVMSPQPTIRKLRTLLKDFTSEDYLLLSGDPATIGVVCSVVSDITNGKYKLLKWDRQEKTYYPLEMYLFSK